MRCSMSWIPAGLRPDIAAWMSSCIAPPLRDSREPESRAMAIRYRRH